MQRVCTQRDLSSVARYRAKIAAEGAEKAEIPTKTIEIVQSFR